MDLQLVSLICALEASGRHCFKKSRGRHLRNDILGCPLASTPHWHPHEHKPTHLQTHIRDGGGGERKLGGHGHAGVCNLRAVAAETGGFLCFSGCQPNSRITERPCQIHSTKWYVSETLQVSPQWVRDKQVLLGKGKGEKRRERKEGRDRERKEKKREEKSCLPLQRNSLERRGVGVGGVVS